MEEKFFLVQIKHTNGNWEKGVVVKDTLNAVRQSYYAYFGAYGFGHDPNTDYVACYIHGMHGETYDAMIDDRISVQEEETEAS